MGLSIIFNTVCVIYSKKHHFPTSLLHSVFVRHDEVLVFLVYQGGLVSYSDNIPDGVLKDKRGMWVDPAEVARGRVIPIYETMTSEATQILAPNVTTVKSALARPGVSFMVPPSALSVANKILENAKWLECMFDPIELPDEVQYEHSDRVCARGHQYRLSDRLTECMLCQGDTVTCGTLGCDQTIPLQVFETVKNSLSPAIRSLVVTVDDQKRCSQSIQDVFPLVEDVGDLW